MKMFFFLEVEFFKKNGDKSFIIGFMLLKVSNNNKVIVVVRLSRGTLNEGSF